MKIIHLISSYIFYAGMQRRKIAVITKGSSQKQNGIDKKKSHQSHMVIAVGQISNDLAVDTRVFFEIFEIG